MVLVHKLAEMQLHFIKTVQDRYPACETMAWSMSDEGIFSLQPSPRPLDQTRLAPALKLHQGGY